MESAWGEEFGEQRTVNEVDSSIRRYCKLRLRESVELVFSSTSRLVDIINHADMIVEVSIAHGNFDSA